MLISRRRQDGKTKQGDTKGHETQSEPKVKRTAETVNTEGQAPEEKSLSDFTVPELKDRAKEQNIEGFSSLKKDELIKALGGE